ncbi:MAG: antibiotic biosynthesis monooxygenase, partial [Hyphomicrobiales bacterium]
FNNWTKSDAFRKAHANAGNTSDGMTLGHPNFEGFEVIQ